MSRSRRKTPIVGITTARSDKPFKVQEHRRERRAARVSVKVGREPENSRAFGDAWLAPKDGKQLVDSHSRWMRK